jgi:hypothetical protein
MRLSRRALLGGALLSLSATEAPLSAETQVLVVYVGGWDCPYCTTWKNEHKAEWLASDLARRVRYVEVDSPKLREAYQEHFWPGELAPVLAQIPRKSGTPRFLVVRNGKIVANEFGAGRWPNAVAAVKKALG